MAASGKLGNQKIGWAGGRMSMLEAAGRRLKESGTLKGLRVSMALHVEAKTAMLAITLKRAGADVRLASCNPLSTDDDVALGISTKHGINVASRRGESRQKYFANLRRLASFKPHVAIDDGGDLTGLLHRDAAARSDLAGICEETTTGIVRAHAMHAAGRLKTPILDVNGAQMKHLFDNRYGTGQSALDGFLRATNLSIAGKTFLVAGYGWCGRGIAMRARGMGAEVIVSEVDPVRAVEARYDGFRVSRLNEAIGQADVVITATGNTSVVGARNLPRLKDGVVLANAGHFDFEIDAVALAKAASKRSTVRPDIEEFVLSGSRRAYLVAKGRLINLAAGSGHPVEIMDASFALQALGCEHLARNGRRLGPGVHAMPPALDDQVARWALAALGLRIDSLSREQRAYMTSFSEGT